jgi:hypothetical protein
MISEALAQSEGYRVEVSGWDENQSFFVEKSDLGWDDFAGKHVSLQRMLPDGAMVFVRTLQTQGLGQSAPIVYKVEFIGCDPDGHHPIPVECGATPGQSRFGNGCGYKCLLENFGLTIFQCRFIFAMLLSRCCDAT